MNTNVKNFKQFVELNNLTSKQITYKSNGIKLRRKGLDLMDVNGNVIITIEPVSYAKGSIYSKDKWKVCYNSTLYYISTLNVLHKKIIVD